MAAIASAKNGLWSATDTWSGGAVPANGDTVTVTHAVEFDVDQSAFAAGLAGLVITSPGVLTASTTAGTYYLKMAGNVTGTGQLVAGSSGTEYPTTCSFTILLNGNYSCQLSASGAYSLWAAEPVHKYVKLATNENSGATQLTVDTDISAETSHWKSGAILRIDNVNKAQDTQEVTFTSVSGTELTVGTALDGNIIAGAWVHLISRNVKIIGTSISGSAYGINGGISGNLRCELRLLNRGVYYGSGHTISGTVSGNTNGIYSGIVYITSTATFATNGHDVNLAEGGLVYGNGVTLASTIPVDHAVVNASGNIPCGVYIDNYGGTAGAYKGWQYGGTVTTVGTQYPAGFTQSYQHALTAASPCFWQRRVTIRAGETLRFTAHFRKDASMTYLPRVWLFEDLLEPLVNAAYILVEQQMTDSTNTWESYALSYKNTGAADKAYNIRFIANNASGNVYTQLYLPPAGGIGARMERIP